MLRLDQNRRLHAISSILFAGPRLVLFGSALSKGPTNRSAGSLYPAAMLLRLFKKMSRGACQILQK